MTDINSLVQAPDVGRRVLLFQLDATLLGAPAIYYFTPGPLDGAPVEFDGDSYFPLPIQATGFEWNGRGPFPTPTLKVSNVANALTAATINYGDLVGAQVTRIRTFERFLDTGSDPDPTSVLPIDTYVIERKVRQDPIEIEWELSTIIDQQGRRLPGEQVLRDACTHRYRRWDPDTNSFDYSKATCPYTANRFYTALGIPTTAAEDHCGKRLGDCKLRFGRTAELPTRAFPGAAKVR